jgi:hypothetical protein
MTMRALRPLAGLLGVAAVGLVASHAVAQTVPNAPHKSLDPKAPMYGVNFETTVGSFKIEDAADPVTGKLTMSFKGTVLVSGLQPDSKVTVSPGIRREIHDTKHNKTVYHGTGTLTFEGKASAIQWFGKNLKARFEGVAIIRLYGEFDNKFNTGTFKYDKIPMEGMWGTGGRQINVPHADQAKPAPKIRINPKGS